MTALLRTEGLTRRYGGRAVVNDTSLSLEAGEVVAVLGPNGSGKSTLFRLLLLLERPDSGTIWLDGRPVQAGQTAAMRRMAGVFQRPYLFRGTVFSNLRFSVKAAGIPWSDGLARIHTALNELGLSNLEDANVAALSGGEAQRVALARALVLQPDVLLLDEPTANLDVTARRAFREEVLRVARSNARSVIVITHDPADAFAMADRILVMQDARIVQAGTPADLLMAPRTRFVAEFTGAELLMEGVIHMVDENLAMVDVASTDLLCTVAGQNLKAGDRVQIAYRPEDVVLSHGADAISSRNTFNLVVDRVAPAGALVRVQLRGPIDLIAMITRDAVHALDIEPGADVTAHVKAAALHAYPASRS